MKKYIRYAILGLLPTTFFACDKFLDVVPDNRTEINTVEKMAKLIADAYPKSCYASILNPRVDYVSDKGGGYTEYSSNTYQFFWRDLAEESQDTPTHFWRRSYYSIAEVNHALEAGENIGYTSKQDPYIAEAKMIRAYSHFMLVNMYAKFYEKDGANNSLGVPYVTKPEKVALESYDRRTVKETYESIEKDLVDAIDKIGVDATYQAPKFHFTQAASRAFATRFYLYKGEWSKVIEHANKVIPTPVSFVEDSEKGVKNVALSDAATIYAKNNFQPWLTTLMNAAGSAQIKQAYSSSENASNLLLLNVPSRLAQYVNSYRYATLYDDIYSTVGANNITGGTWAYRIMSSGSFHYYVPKFESKLVKEEVNATSGVRHTAIALFRSEEILLNRAEAYAMLDQYDEAIADLNIFCRQRIKSYNEISNAITEAKLLSFYGAAFDNPEHFMAKYNAYNSNSWSELKKALILCILDFRRNEFMWEGLRYFDMLRYKIPVTHKNFKGESNTLYPGDDRWVLQIPETSTLAGMELNPRTNLLSREW